MLIDYKLPLPPIYPLFFTFPLVPLPSLMLALYLEVPVYHVFSEHCRKQEPFNTSSGAYFLENIMHIMIIILYVSLYILYFCIWLLFYHFPVRRGSSG